eukprot:COSAG01_NODE_27654_length_680_cov_1.024096_1_plen_104_part_10
MQATIVDWLIILLAIYIVSEWNFFVFDLKAAEDNLMGAKPLYNPPRASHDDLQFGFAFFGWDMAGDEALAVKRMDVINFSNELAAAVARFDRFRALNAVPFSDT